MDNSFFAVDGDLGLFVANDSRKPHFRCFRFLRILCGNCAGVKKTLVFIDKSGCPTWIRTMTKASKELCATITPSDRRGEKLTP